MPERCHPHSSPTWSGSTRWSGCASCYREDKSRKLSDISARLGIALESAHRAASDAEAAGRVLLALAERMPTSYAEVISLQAQYAARQELDLSRNRRR